MNVKEAVHLAKHHILDLFAEEQVSNLGLEEVEYDGQEADWIVTLGFSRPWDAPRNSLASLAMSALPRSYKVVRISDETEQVLSVKNREPN